MHWAKANAYFGINEKYRYSELTGKIIGCAMEVHRHLGNGFQEVIYQRALSIELNMQGIAHIREQEMPLSYKNHDIGTRRVDFLNPTYVLGGAFSLRTTCISWINPDLENHFFSAAKPAAKD